MVRAPCFKCDGKMILTAVTEGLKHTIYFCVDCRTLFIVHLAIDGKRDEYPLKSSADIHNIQQLGINIAEI